jgi:hypothetical protein
VSKLVTEHDAHALRRPLVRMPRHEHLWPEQAPGSEQILGVGLRDCDSAPQPVAPGDLAENLHPLGVPYARRARGHASHADETGGQRQRCEERAAEPGDHNGRDGRGRRRIEGRRHRHRGGDVNRRRRARCRTEDRHRDAPRRHHQADRHDDERGQQGRDEGAVAERRGALRQARRQEQAGGEHDG